MKGLVTCVLLQAAAALGPTYLVQEGDTLEMISSMHGLTTTEMAHINRLPDRHTIQTGWTLNTTGPAVELSLMQGRHWHRNRDNACVACCACNKWKPNHQDSCRWTRCPGLGGGTLNYCWDQGEMLTKLEGGDKVPNYGRGAAYEVREPERFEIPKGATGYKDPNAPVHAKANHPFGNQYYNDFEAADWHTCSKDLGKDSCGTSEFKDAYPACNSMACRYEPEPLNYPDSSKDRAPLSHP